MQQLLKNKTNRNCFLKWYRTAYRMRTRRIECKKDSSADLPLSALWHDRNFRYNLREAFFFLEECFKFHKIFLIRNLYFDEVGNYSKHPASESRAVEVMRNNDAFFLSLRGQCSAQQEQKFRTCSAKTEQYETRKIRQWA